MTRFTTVEGRDTGDIAYSYIDVDLLAPEESGRVRQEQLKHNPNGSFPTIVVDGDCIVGYDEGRLSHLVEG